MKQNFSKSVLNEIFFISFYWNQLKDCFLFVVDVTFACL